MWARVGDGDSAHTVLNDHVLHGLATNLFNARSVFQINANFGVTAGIAEMLLQSHDGAIHLLPALPDVWKDGKITGLRARGGFLIESMEWKDGELVRIEIKSILGGNCRIRSYRELALVGKGEIQKASSKNENTFYQTNKTKEPIISKGVDLKQYPLKERYLCGIETKAGEAFILRDYKIYEMIVE